MGKLLHSKKLVPDLIISSTAERAVKTAEIVAKASKYENEIIYSDKLYMAEPTAIMDTILEHGKKKKVIMVIGHNPGLEAFLQILTGKVETLPTASIAYLTAKIEKWDELSEEKEVKLRNLWRPKD
jgi:phosphohistidine phosphatase